MLLIAAFIQIEIALKRFSFMDRLNAAELKTEKIGHLQSGSNDLTKLYQLVKFHRQVALTSAIIVLLEDPKHTMR